MGKKSPAGAAPPDARAAKAIAEYKRVAAAAAGWQKPPGPDDRAARAAAEYKRVSEVATGEPPSAKTETALIKTVAPREGVHRRVAKFLLLIGLDEAAKVLSCLGEEETEKIIPEIAFIKGVGPEEAEEILEEFQSLLRRRQETGGVDAARAILQSAFGPGKAQEVLKKALPYPEGKPFEALDKLDSNKLFLLLRDESLEVTALALSRVRSGLAAGVIKLMGKKEKAATAKRLATLKPVSPEVVRKVDQRLTEKLRTLNAAGTAKLDGQEALAQILRRMDPGAEKNILEALEKDAPEAAKRLRERLFTLEDVLRSEDYFIQTELALLEDTDVARLLAGKPLEFREKILSNVSAGRAVRIREDEEIFKPFKRADCDRITADFLGRLRHAWETGKLIMLDTPEDEFVE